MSQRPRLIARIQRLLKGLAGRSRDRQEDRAPVQEILDRALAAISAESACESVGIRWKAGGDYPYYATRGFGRDFVVIEGPLCVRDAAGLVLRHRDGRQQLACLCGAVIQGRTDPAQPYFTAGGSFWTNGTTSWLRDSPSGLPGITPRNYCNAVGYESVALIPLRTGGKVLGLLQLNSRSPGRFTPETITHYEQVAAEIAAALAHTMQGGAA